MSPTSAGVVEARRGTSGTHSSFNIGKLSPSFSSLSLSLVAVYYHVQRGMAKTPAFNEIFSERLYPLTNGAIDLDTLPTAEAVYKFVSTIFHAEKLALECVILCLAYVERIIETGLTLLPENWRRVVLSALILASKVWEDQAVWNVDFLSIFPNINVIDLNKLEKQVLHMLKFSVTLSGSKYASYYFELRQLSDLDEASFPLRPLDKAGQERLEARAQDQEEQFTRRHKRSQSLDSLTKRSGTRIVLG